MDLKSIKEKEKRQKLYGVQVNLMKARQRKDSQTINILEKRIRELREG